MPNPAKDNSRSEARLAAHYAQCEQDLRETDRDCRLACLYAPREARKHLHAVCAFAREIAGTRDRISEPLMGEMRLRWWLDALEQAEDLGARAHPVADAFLDTIERKGIPRAEAAALIEAHSFDLYAEPMESLGELEDYALRTVAAPLRWCAQIIGSSGGAQERETLTSAGLALGLTRVLASLPKQIAHGQTFMPMDVAARRGAGDDIRRGIASPGARAALSDLRERARAHYTAARRAARDIPGGQAALLQAATVPLYLDAGDKPGVDPFRCPCEPSPWRRQWRLWRAARAGGLG